MGTFDNPVSPSLETGGGGLESDDKDDKDDKDAQSATETGGASPISTSPRLGLTTSPSPPLPSGIVRFRVGGVNFETTRRTIEAHEGSMLEALTAPLWSLPGGPDVTFVDRDPRLFEVVMTFMRDGVVRMPPGMDAEALQAEFDYYQL